jgi:hypothetical protein
MKNIVLDFDGGFYLFSFIISSVIWNINKFIHE